MRIVYGILATALVATALVAGGRPKKYPAGTHILKTNQGMQYVLHVPKRLGRNGALLVCLHGAGMRGINDIKGVWSGWMNAFGKSGYLVVAPEAAGNAWTQAEIQQVTSLAKRLAEAYGLPARRCAVAGHSSGAEAAARVLQGAPRLFSAGVSIGGRPTVNAKTMKEHNLAFFFFHYTQDNIVNVAGARQAHQTLKKEGVVTDMKEVGGKATHAIEFYLADSLKQVQEWLKGWLTKGARKLGTVGASDAPFWAEGVLDPVDEAEKRDMKLIMVYSYDSGKDADSKVAQWLEWDLFPQEEFAEAVEGVLCVKLDRKSAGEDVLKKLKCTRSGLYFYNRKAKKLKSYTSPTTMKRLKSDIARMKKQTAKDK